MSLRRFRRAHSEDRPFDGLRPGSRAVDAPGDGYWEQFFDTHLMQRRLLALVALALILLAGAYFRFTGLDWDQGQHLHPDERVLTGMLASLSRPASLSQYFDTAASRWNPHNTGYDFFPYGTLPIFIIRFVGEVLNRVKFGEIYLLGRALSGAFDLLTVLLLFFITRRLYDTRVALLASALSAAAVLQIQQSHFMTVDTFATTFVTLAFLLAVFVAEDGQLWQYLLMGLAVGMSVASRINLVVFLPVALTAAGLHARRLLAKARDQASQLEAMRRVAIGLVLAVLAFFLAFRLFQPYAFDGPGVFGLHLNGAWLEDMRTAYALNAGEIDYPPSHQWVGRPDYLFPWSHMVLWGLGLPLGLAGWAGWLVAGWQVVRQRRWQHMLPVVWVLVVFGYHGQQFVKAMRYFLPIYPTLAMLAAFLLVRMWDNRLRISYFVLRDRVPEGPIRSTQYALRTGILPGTLLLLVIAGTYTWALAFTRIYTRPVTRVTASRWIYDHVSSAATVHYQAMDGMEGQAQVPISLDDRPARASDGFVLGPGGVPYQMTFTPIADGRLGTVKFTQLEELERDSEPETIEVTLASDPTGQAVLAMQRSVIHLEQTSGPHTVRFSGVPVQAGRRYYVLMRAIDGGNVRVTGREPGFVTYWTDQGLEIEILRSAHIRRMNRWGIVYSQAKGQTTSAFRLARPGTVQSITMNRLIDPMGDPEPETFQVAIAGSADGREVLARARITAHMEVTDHLRGEVYTFELPAVQLEADREYYLVARVVDGAPVQAWSSIIANEHWDDPIPLPVDGKDPGIYHNLAMEHYNNDSPEKLDELMVWLDQADYIMLTSNRLYGSIPRLPLRYPITAEYYRLLFRGELGFELERTFTSYPNIGPIPIPDQSAEESFTVYDHPKVWIFRKTTDFSRTKVRAMLADAADGPFIPLRPVYADQAPSALFLQPDRWARQQQAGTWLALFDPGSLVNRSAPLTLLVWLLAVEFIGLVAFPVANLALGRLAHGGYLLSKVLGLLLLAWLIWFLSSVTSLPYARWSIALSLLILAGLSAIIAHRHRTALTRFIVENRRLLLIGETLFLFAFFTFLLVRVGNPDLWHPAWGGEKPMDFAYLNAVVKSITFPPYDPWFAGGYMNYYYFGFVIVGTVIKLLGIVPATAYNLAVPTLFALTFVGAFVIVYNLVGASRKGRSVSPTDPESQVTREGAPQRLDVSGRPNTILSGLLGGLFVVVIGNLEEAKIVLRALREAGGSGFWSAMPGLGALVSALRGLARVIRGEPMGVPSGDLFWNASRVMPNGEINEFPYFTFLYGDLHAHMIALPLALLALAMAVHLIRDARQRGVLTDLGVSLSGLPGVSGWVDSRELCSLALWGLVIGALRATNTWDYPTYLTVAGGTLIIREWSRRATVTGRLFWAVGWRFALVVLTSVVVVWPFTAYYATAYTSVELWAGQRTQLGDYLTIHGFFLFIIGTFLLVNAVTWWRGRAVKLLSEKGEWGRLMPYAHMAGFLVVVALMLVYFRLWMFIVAFPLAGLAMWLLFRREGGPEGRLIAYLFLLALTLTLAVEVVVLKGDIGRMNTVFKFYMQVWVLWGVVAAVCLAWLWPTIRRWEGVLGQAWWSVLVMLGGAVLLYPMMATPAKIDSRFGQATGPSLNGLTYLETAILDEQHQDLPLRYDRQAIRWLQQNVPGTPVVLEANTPPHGWGGRVSTYTGLPTLIGWDWHQEQQRSILPRSLIDRRVEDVREIYNTSDAQQALHLLERYDVGYVYVGGLERAYYESDGLAKFDHMVQDGALEIVYENPEVRIYQVRH